MYYIKPNTYHFMNQIEQVLLSVSSTYKQTESLKSSREYTLADETYTYSLAGTK